VSTLSTSLFVAGLVVLLAGIVVPGWDTATTPKRAMKRRIYWTATAVSIPILIVAGWPDLQRSIAFVAMACVLMIGWAYSRTPNLKIGDRIYAAYEPNREPDPPPPGPRV